MFGVEFYRYPHIMTMEEILYLKEETSYRFWSKVDKKSDNECWNWKGKTKKGYGWFTVHTRDKVREFIASRVALYLSGVDVKDLFVLHSCDNPPCCNPNHLRTGTAKDNSRDMVERGRLVGRKKIGGCEKGTT